MPKSPNYSEIEKLQKEAALESKRTDLKLQKLSESVQKLSAGNAELKESVQKMAAGNAELKESVQKMSDKVDRMAEINSAESDKTDLKLQKMAEINSAGSKKTDLKLQKMAEINSAESKKTDLKLQKMAEINSAESKKTDLKLQKMAKINSAESKKVDIIDEMYEDFSTGLSTEEKFYKMFKANPVLGKISFDEVHKNIFMLPSLEIEIDILLSNGTALGICEVKTRLKKTDIKKFFEKKTIPKFIKFNNPYYNKLNYYVVFACETMASDVLDETKKHDCFLISSDFKKDKFVIHQSSQH